MNLERHRGSWVIFLSFIFSFMLAIMPIPVWATVWRPDWIALVLIFWCITIPQRVGIATASLVGIILDVLRDTLLGQHAFSLGLIAFFTIKLHLRMRLFPKWQQAMLVFGFIIISQLLAIWIHSIFGLPTMGVSILYSAFTSMLLWPWMFIILRDLQSTYKVL